MFYFWLGAAYILGSAVGFYFGRKHGISVGSALTFDLLVHLGYVKHDINEDGEIQIHKARKD